MKKTITIENVKVGSKFKNKYGTIFIIDGFDYFDGLTLVCSSLEYGVKGNYKTEINDLVAFFNEEECVIIEHLN